MLLFQEKQNKLRDRQRESKSTRDHIGWYAILWYYHLILMQLTDQIGCFTYIKKVDIWIRSYLWDFKSIIYFRNLIKTVNFRWALVPIRHLVG